MLSVRTEKLWKSAWVWFTCLVNTQEQVRNPFLTYIWDLSEKYFIFPLNSLCSFYLLLFFSLFQIQFCLSKSTTEAIQRARLKVIKYCAAPQSNAVAPTSSFLKTYSLCKYLSVRLIQCSSLHSTHRNCCLQYPKAQLTLLGSGCCSHGSRGLEMSGLNSFLSACPQCPADTWNGYSSWAAAPETFCYRLP